MASDDLPENPFVGLNAKKRTGSQTNLDDNKPAEWANAIAEKVRKIGQENDKLKKQVSAEAEHARGCNILFNGVTYEEVAEKAAPAEVRDFLLERFINNPQGLGLNIGSGNFTFIFLNFFKFFDVMLNIISEFVSDVHRIQSKKEPKPIIIQFVRQLDAKSVKTNAWKMKSINEARKKKNSKLPPVVIIDHHEPEKNKKIGYLNAAKNSALARKLTTKDKIKINSKPMEPEIGIDGQRYTISNLPKEFWPLDKQKNPSPFKP